MQKYRVRKFPWIWMVNFLSKCSILEKKMKIEKILRFSTFNSKYRKYEDHSDKSDYSKLVCYYDI